MQPGWEAADDLGVRIFAPELPGFGHSTFQPERRILDWPADVTALADHVGAERFRVVGVSARTSYALACGVALPDRVDAVGVIAGTVPIDDDAEVARRVASDPDAVWADIERELEATAGDVEASVHRLGERPEPDGPLYRRPDVQQALIAAARETYRQGVKGPAYDTRLRISPWGFDLADVEVPCLWWHGEADAVVPLGRVRAAIDALPQHALHVVPDVGHGVSMTHTAEFLRALLACARPPTVLPTSRAGFELRTLTADDAVAYHALVQANRDHLLRLNDDHLAEVNASVADLAARFSDSADRSLRLGMWLDGRLVGHLALVHRAPPRWGLGYWLAEHATGLGLATTAVTALLEHASTSLGAEEVLAGVSHGNDKSVAVLHRCGFSEVEVFDTYTRFSRRLR